MANHITQVWTAWISISCLNIFYIAEYGAPLYVPRAHIFAIFYVLNSMLVYVKWFSVAQQLVHDLEERACRMCIVCLSSHNLQACMLHIRGPCTVKSGLCGLRLCAVFTQMTLSQKLKLPRYVQLLSLRTQQQSTYSPLLAPVTRQLIHVYVCTTTLCIQVQSIAFSSVVFLLCSSAGDLEESKTTQHTSAIGD